MNKALFSKYIIDGVPQDLTPAAMLGVQGAGNRPGDALCIVDESVDPEIGPLSFHSTQMESYLQKVLESKRSFPLPFPSEFTRFRIASALIDSLWRIGHFNIGDLALSLSWRWNESHVGSMAAFYRSVEAASACLDDLGLNASDFSCAEGEPLEFSVKAMLESRSEGDETTLRPFCSENPYMEEGRRVPSELVNDPKSWVVYLPFDTCECRLGGSMLSEATGKAGGLAVDVSDTDYFQDCFEVVREMVEDGIVMSGVSVADGGLMAALNKMTKGSVGLVADVGELMEATAESDIVNRMFAEVPGVVLQISDSDFDYIDAEFLLQDVAYYPIGHPSGENSSLKVRSSVTGGIQKILASLVQNQGAEGED